MINVDGREVEVEFFSFGSMLGDIEFNGVVAANEFVPPPPPPPPPSPEVIAMAGATQPAVDYNATSASPGLTSVRELHVFSEANMNSELVALAERLDVWLPDVLAGRSEIPDDSQAHTDLAALAKKVGYQPIVFSHDNGDGDGLEVTERVVPEEALATIQQATAREAAIKSQPLPSVVEIFEQSSSLSRAEIGDSGSSDFDGAKFSLSINPSLEQELNTWLPEALLGQKEVPWDDAQAVSNMETFAEMMGYERPDKSIINAGTPENAWAFLQNKGLLESSGWNTKELLQAKQRSYSSIPWLR